MAWEEAEDKAFPLCPLPLEPDELCFSLPYFCKSPVLFECRLQNQIPTGNLIEAFTQFSVGVLLLR